ncbi:MAG: DegQ family serine endoprotease [Proteobacteria bacterium]|nr:DegQ family serine endoprotease [Pseudomonadota bacterium]
MNALTSRVVPIAAAIAIGIASCFPLAQAATVNLPDFTALVEQDGPAVVSIEAIHDGGKRGAASNRDDGSDQDIPDIFKRFFGDQGMPMPMPTPRGEGTALGSGFIISADGKILTNHHVVDGADRVIVHLADRREFTARVIGSDPMSDVALLKVQASGLPYLKLATAKSLKPGQWVVAIGSPFGLDHSVTAGIVSGVGRSSIDPGQQYVPFIQTDVPINKGNSGGPLLNINGEVVGINSQIFSMSGGYMGVSFAIPIETAMNAVTQIETTGHVRRGVLGVRIQEVTSQIASAMGLARSGGALVAGVEPGTAAARAGVKTGDLIVAFNGAPIDSSADLPPLVGAQPPGAHATLKIDRNGKTIELPVVLDDLASVAGAPKLEPAAGSQSAAPATAAQKIGLAVQDLNPAQRKAMKLDSGEGVLVTRVVDDVARRAGLQAGDVILRVGRHDVGNVAAFGAATAQIKPGDTVMLLVRRNEQTQFIAVGPIQKS